MYAVLTKNGNTYDLPVVKTGNSNVVIKHIQERDDVTYQANIVRVWSKDELKDVGIVRFSEPKVPTGKIESGSKEDTLTSYEVTRKSVWIDDPDYVAPDPEALLRESLIKTIKTEAYERIIQIIPEWKQRNLTAQAAQLAEKGRVNWTAEELAAWDAGVLIWDQVSVIRSKSDSLEQSVLEMTYDELKEFDPRLDEVWV